MSCFNKVSTVTANSDLDLTKHVNYTSGMILGVDDFTQEFAYLAGRDRWLARDALGFGTVSGLTVEVDKDGSKGARVMVSPGVAISPRGQFICVSSAQCAYLNEWIAANSADLTAALKPLITSPPVTSPHLKDELKLYVVLCYRDCPVDNVPIPGEPCRSEEELTAASRISDDFSLEMRLKAPKQPEEQKVREFVEWLRNIKIVETGDSTPDADFKNAVRAKWLPPPTSPPAVSSPAVLQINVEDISEYMRTAFRLWVTELRNVLSERKTGCAVEMTGGESIEDCVLLAELRVPLVPISNGLKVSDSEAVAVDEENRPFLLHLRMLQELMLGNLANVSGHPPITSPGSAPKPVSLRDLTDVKFTAVKEGHTLFFDGTKWINKKVETGGGGGVTDHKNLTKLLDDDHPQYLPVDGKRPMKDSLDAGGFPVRNVKKAEKDGDAVVFEQAVKITDDAKGDVGGKYDGLIVTGLQNNKVSPNKPQPDNILVFKNEAWTPQKQEQVIFLPFANIARAGAEPNLFDVWFNIDHFANLVEVDKLTELALTVHGEDENKEVVAGTHPEAFLTPLPLAPLVGTVPPIFKLSRNVFRVRLQREMPLMRFRFLLQQMTVSVNSAASIKMINYLNETNIKFLGQSPNAKGAVTIFVRGR